MIYPDHHGSMPNSLKESAKLVGKIGCGIVLLAATGAFAQVISNAISVHNILEKRASEPIATPFIPPTKAALLREQMEKIRPDGSWDILTTASSQITVEDKDGINVRDVHGDRVQTGKTEPFYEVLQRTGQPLSAEISNYLIEYDQNKDIKRISAIRWINDGSTDNGGLGRVELIAAFDKKDGCLVSFTNPQVQLCTLKSQ